MNTSHHLLFIAKMKTDFLFSDKEDVEDFTSMTSGLTTVPLTVTYDENEEGEMCALATGITIRNSKDFSQLHLIPKRRFFQV